MGKCMADAQPKIEAFFKHYDAPKQCFWTPAEAATFFGHFAKEWPLTEFQNVEHAAKAKAMMRAFEVQADTEVFERMQVEEQKRIQAEIAQKLASYLENKDDRDAEAFKLVDSNGDGKIDLSELVAALTPSSPKYKEMVGALGLLAGQEPTKQGGRCSVM